ncbi:MAG: phage holin family protein, partial [Chitinophagales bacterium]
LSIYLAAIISTGVQYDGITGLLLSALVLTAANILLRPLITVIALPFNLITLGILFLIINTWMVILTDSITHSLQITGFWNAFLVGTLIILFSWLIGRAKVLFAGEPIRGKN